MTIRESMAGEFGDKMFVLCPTCSQRATGCTVYTAMAEASVGILIRTVPGPSKIVMRPCGHVVDSFSYRMPTEVRDATA